MENVRPVVGADGVIFWVSESIYRQMVHSDTPPEKPKPTEKPKRKAPTRRTANTRKPRGSVS